MANTAPYGYKPPEYKPGFYVTALRSEIKATGEIDVMMRLIIQDFNGDGEERITPISYADHFALCDEKGRLL